MAHNVFEGFMLGFSMGAYCTVSCTPFLIPYLLSSDKNDFFSKTRIFLEFLFGRLTAYILFAFVFSIIGISLDIILTQTISGILIIISSLIMIVFNFYRISKNTSHCYAKLSKWTKRFPFVSGFILGLNLCPPFAVALTKVLEIKNILNSIMFFIFLFLGTTIYLFPFPVVASFLKTSYFKRLGIHLGFLVGVYFLIQGIIILL